MRRNSWELDPAKKKVKPHQDTPLWSTFWVFCLSHSNWFIFFFSVWMSFLMDFVRVFIAASISFSFYISSHLSAAVYLPIPFKFVSLFFCKNNVIEILLSPAPSMIEGGSVLPPPWLMCWISFFWNHEDKVNSCKQYPPWSHHRLLCPWRGRNDWITIHTHYKRIKPVGLTLNDHQPRSTLMNCLVKCPPL